MLPLTVFSAAVLVQLVDREVDLVRRSTMERTRAVMSAVDAELQGSLDALRALATSRALERGDLEGFHDDARRVLGSHSGWLTVTLADASGKLVVDAAKPLGAELGTAIAPETLPTFLLRRQPSVGDVAQVPLARVASVPVRVAVLRDAGPAYVITALLNLDSFGALLRGQRLPEGWVIAIADKQRRFVARIPHRAPGEPAAPGFSAALAQGLEGWYRARTVEGRDTFQAFTRSEASGWGVGIAIPVDEVWSGAWRAAAAMGAGAVFSIAVGVLMALFFARRIAAPIGSLATSARALGAGSADVPIQARARVDEVNEVADALAAAAEAVRAREQSLVSADGELRAANRAKDEFLATLSHELRNPLAAISMSAEVLRHSLADQRVILRTADVLERQSGQMSRLVEDLLDMSRITFGKVSIDPRPMDLAQAVERIAGTWRASGRFAGHEVRFDLAPAWILADSGRVEQVAANLLDNALKFTPRDGQVAVRVAREGGVALLEVSDTGRGLSASLRDSAFDVFVQGDQSLDRPAGGLGIGLALVRRIAELHGGSAEAHSQGEGRGATFVVRFPAIDEAAPPGPASASIGIAAARRILVVEDNDDSRTMLCTLLRAEGHTVSEASDAASALAAIETARPDAALVDIGLPGMSGYTLVRQLRERLGRGALLIALTGYGGDADRRRALEAGFDLHLVKPVDGERLRSALEDAVAARGTAL